MIKGGVPRLKAPKAEYYLLAPDGRRPHYKWTQLNDFDHAGYPMPPLLAELCAQLNADFGLTGDDRLNHCLVICNEQSGDGPDAHCAPPHADKIQKGFFFDVSLGYARTMQLIDADVYRASQGKIMEEVAAQPLASASLAFISAADNGRLVQGSKKPAGESKVVGTRYLHLVPVDAAQPRDQPRFSLVFRPITDHPKGDKRGEHLAKVDEAKAARVRPGGDLWRAYVPLCRGGSGADPLTLESAHCDALASAVAQRSAALSSSAEGVAAQLERASLGVATIGDGVEVEPSRIDGAGRGLHARGRTFKTRQRITEYAGERLADKLAAARRAVQTHILHLSPTFHGQHGNDVYIDGDREPVRDRGGGSFANHLPKAQCNADFALHHGTVYLVATDDIADGDEIYVHCGTDLDVMMGRARREVYAGYDGRPSIRLVPLEA